MYQIIIANGKSWDGPCLRHFLNQYSPTCNYKYTHLGKWGELLNKQDVKNLLQYFGYTIHPTEYSTSHQNGPVKRFHGTLDSSIRSMLTRANLNIFFFNALYHAIWISNSFPEPNTVNFPIEKAKTKQENLSFLCTFGFHVCVRRHPVNRKAKLKNHVSKRILLGYYPHTNRNVLYCDVDKHIIKLASCVWFDEGINDLPIVDTNLNVQHLQRVDNEQHLPEEKQFFPNNQFEFSISPFTGLIPVLLK